MQKNTRNLDSVVLPFQRSNELSVEQSSALLEIQRKVMEKVALGHDPQLTLDALCHSVEAMVDNAVASVMKFDKSTMFLEVISAPSLPGEAKSCLDGLIPDRYAGSCGTAVYSNEAQYVYDTRVDDRWQHFQQFVTDFNVGACWSVPIRTSDDAAIGSFALSSFEQRKPSLFYRNLLETAAHIAGIILKRQQEEKILWDMAHYDSLTGLPNRSFFQLRLEHAIEKANRNNTKVALLFLDLDKFKDINDSEGHDCGDKVLKYAADQMIHCLRKNDTLARIGGDEFIILIEDVEDITIVQKICDKVKKALAQEQSPSFIKRLLTTSIGISLYPDDANTSSLLLRNADTAMYEAKKQGVGQYCFYKQMLTEEVTARLSTADALESALIREEFVVYYQPQYCCKSGDIKGAEALVRWQHPEKGVLPPSDFITIAEETGLISGIGEQVFKIACRQCVEWWNNGLPQFVLAINLSVSELKNGYSEKLLDILKQIKFPIELLELEITESMIMDASNRDELKKLHKFGFKIAMDDFGTGHSSLAQLKHLPISKLKIDRSFVKDIPDDENDMIVAQTIITMGHSLGLKVVAEGVETKEQKDFFIEKGSDFLQGFLLSKPLPSQKMEEFLIKYDKKI